MTSVKQTAQLVQMSCVLEACAPKPGNVNRFHDFSDTSLEDYLVSAIAIGPAFERADRLSIGEIILQAVENTRRHVRSNTNLGMILLLAPLVKAGISATGSAEIRAKLDVILRSLTLRDAELAYAAIRMAHPGGLGHVSNADVTEKPSINLLEAMILAKERDSVAREYATSYAITFEIGSPALKEALSRERNFSNAIVHAYLTILSQVPDTLIARKVGFEAARQVSQNAALVLERGGLHTKKGRSALAEFDRSLRDSNHTLNPGTTADLTTAATFLTLASAPDHT